VSAIVQTEPQMIKILKDLELQISSSVEFKVCSLSEP